MKPTKSIAALAAGAVIASGGAAVALAGAAQATTNTFHLYAQIKKTTLQPTSYDRGNQSVTMTVTPASAAPNASIAVVVSSSTYNIKNGPAANAATGAEELDAVISLNGTDYVLRGSQNGQEVDYDDSDLGGTNTPNYLFNAGWSTSSTPGASSSSSTNTTASGGAVVGTAAGSTGLGTAVRGAEGTIVALKAPALTGTYPIVLKSIILNAVAGSSTVALTDDFDNFINLTNCLAACATSGNAANFAGNVSSSYIDPFSPAVSLAVVGPDFAINKITTQNDTYDIPNSSTATNGAIGPKARSNGTPTNAGDNATLQGTNSNWTPSSKVYATVCTDAAGTSCAPAGAESALWAGTTGGYTTANGFASWTTDAGGNLPLFTVNIGSWSSYSNVTLYLYVYQTTTRPAPPGYSGANTQGPVSTGLTAKASHPIYALTSTRTVNTTATSPALGQTIVVTGTGYYPNEQITVGEATSAPAAVGTPNTACAADSSGNLSCNLVIDDLTGTQVYSIAHGVTGSVTTYGGAFTVSGTSCEVAVTDGSAGCSTTQNLYATVTAGKLSQAASLTNACTPPTTSASPTLPSATAYNPVNGCNTNASSIGFGAVQTKATAQQLTGSLNTVTVTDLRGGNLGWDLTAQVVGGALTSGSHSIPASNISIGTGGASCTEVDTVNGAPNGTGATAGTTFGSSVPANPAATSYANAVVLCRKDTTPNATSGSTSGQWTVASTLNLNVPAFTGTGSYTGQLKITLA